MKQLLVGCYFLTFFGVQNSIHAQNQFEFNIVKDKTKKHQRLAGTRIYWIPNKYFTYTPAFFEMKGKDSNSINFSESNEGFAKHLSNWRRWFKGLNALVTDSVELKLNDLSGVQYTLRGDTGRTAYVLIFGNTTNSSSIGITINKTSDEFITNLSTVLSNLFIDWDFQPDPFEIANFTIDLSNSTFKLNEFENGNYKYTLGGKMVEELKENENVFTLQMTPPLKLSDLERERKTMGLWATKDVRIYYSKKISSGSINGIMITEFEYSAFYDSRKLIIYHASLSSGDKAIEFEALVQNDVDITLKEMQRLVRTIVFN